MLENGRREVGFRREAPRLEVVVAGLVVRRRFCRRGVRSRKRGVCVGGILEVVCVLGAGDGDGLM